jgi:REP element-mobilizing transposase RayT
VEKVLEKNWALAQYQTFMPWIKVWIHFVWATKNHEPFLLDEIRTKVFHHIRENARAKGIFIDHIGGYLDHVHCLISLGSGQSLDEIMRLIKGESSHWINKAGITKFKFAWQDEYFAVSVNPSGLPSVRKYISNQEEHHKKTTFPEEFESFLVRAGFQRFPDKRPLG